MLQLVLAGKVSNWSRRRMRVQRIHGVCVRLGLLRLLLHMLYLSRLGTVLHHVQLLVTAVSNHHGARHLHAHALLLQLRRRHGAIVPAIIAVAEAGAKRVHMGGALEIHGRGAVPVSVGGFLEGGPLLAVAALAEQHHGAAGGKDGDQAADDADDNDDGGGRARFLALGVWGRAVEVHDANGLAGEEGVIDGNMAL